MDKYTCKLLRINLSTGGIREELVPEQDIMDFVGGRGFGIQYLYQELAPGIDPLGEQNKLLILAGVLTGTSAQAASRWMVCTKSPLTGGFARSSAGGDFGAWLKFSGYDSIIIEGKAKRPVYIHLTHDSCQIHDANELWGTGTQETQEILRQSCGKDAQIACIGPAGERLVRYAAIITKDRAAGRCGVGTVMGSKNLKAIVVTARRSVKLRDPETFKQLVKEQIGIFNDNDSCQHHKVMGTIDTQDITSSLGVFPVKNFRYGCMADWKKIAGQEYQKLEVGREGCYSCSIQCGHAHYVPTGPYAGARSGGTEYETICMFTGSIDSTSIEATIAANQLCNDLGLDTISTGNCIGFAYELYEKGILTQKDTDGLKLNYGNHSAMIDLVRKIAWREGIGNILAEGTMRAAATIGNGAEAYAMQVKGLELPGYDPRGAKSQGFNMATSNIGASHNYGYAVQEIFGVTIPRKVDRFAEEENADVVIYNQDSKAMWEVGLGCEFSQGWGWFPDLFAKMLGAATGIDNFADVGYLWKVGERIVNLERVFNIREGFRRKDDYLPTRMLTEPLRIEDVPGKGQMVRNMDKFLDRYYRLRGWTPEGIPSRQHLEELGLGYVIKDIS